MTNEERDALIAQGWTPPVGVDPDLEEADRVTTAWRHDRGKPWIKDAVLDGIKRGRELEREAQPGMVWKKWDGSDVCPVGGALVTVSVGHSHYETNQSSMIDWLRVSHYAIITQPEEK